MFRFLLVVIFLFQSAGFALTNDEKAKIIQEEYFRLRSFVQNLAPDYQVGGYYNAKEYGDTLLMWRLKADEVDHESIRIYRSREEQNKNFSVTYHRSSEIMENKIVLRRIYGPEPVGYRTDTINYLSGEYLERHGMIQPEILPAEQEVFQKWNITPFID